MELDFQTLKRKELDRIGLEHDLVKIDDELTGRAVSVRVPAITFSLLFQRGQPRFSSLQTAEIGQLSDLSLLQTSLPRNLLIAFGQA